MKKILFIIFFIFFISSCKIIYFKKERKSECHFSVISPKTCMIVCTGEISNLMRETECRHNLNKCETTNYSTYIYFVDCNLKN